MSMTKRFAVVAGISAILAGGPPALAQFEGADPELAPLAGIDEIDVVEFGPLAQAPDAPPPPFIAHGPGMPGAGGGPGPGRCPMDSGCGPFGALSGENALTDEQFEKLYEIKSQYLDKAGQKMVELHNSERHMKDLLTQVSVDKQKVKELQGKINEQRAALANLRLEKKLASLDVLTEAQRKEMRSKLVKGECPPGRAMMRQCKKMRGHG